jgi:Family of unknown function (DUF5683)
MKIPSPRSGYLLFPCLLLASLFLQAQVKPLGDSTARVKATEQRALSDSLYKNSAMPAVRLPKTPDTSTRKKRSDPGKAALRSALLPGLGQAYNKKYWKIPIVYGALAVPTATFIYNKNWYDKTREAFTIKFHNDTNKVVPDLPTDGMDPRLVPLSTESTRLYRNQFRKNMDLSVLFFLLIWGLQVADAAVDAHLKTFSVSDELSLQVRPSLISTGQSPGIGLNVRLQIGRSAPQRVTTVTR